MSIRIRIALLMMITTIVPVLVLTLVAAANTLKSVRTEMIDANSTRVEWAAQYLEEILLRLDDLFYSLQMDEGISSAIAYAQAHRTLPRAGEVAAGAQLRAALSSSYYSHARIIDDLSLFVLDASEEILFDAIHNGDIRNAELRSSHWTPLLQSPFSMFIQDEDGVLRVYHSINRFENRALKGGLSVHLDEEVKDYLLEILASRMSGGIVLLNDWGEIILESGAEHPAAAYARMFDTHQDTSFSVQVERMDTDIAFLRSIKDGRVRIVRTLPLSLVSDSSRPVIAAGFLISGVLLLASVLSAFLFSSWISRPIIALAQKLKHTPLVDFENQLASGRDELGVLEEGYQALIHQLREHIKNEYQVELELRNAHLNALHAQINPHFLYNTLQLIGGMGLSSNVPEIYRVSKAVGDMFRYTTEREGKLVPLERELAHVKNYLLIQEMRFEGRFSVRFDVDAELLRTAVPQFTLQPLIENAFEHGLQQQAGRWTLYIGAKLMRQGVLLSIQDNGVGMDAATLNRQRKRLRENDPGNERESAHIGLQNVDGRLRLHFGERYRIMLFSREGRGTKVVCVLPYRRMEAVHDI